MNPIILALDVPTEAQAFQLIENVGDRVGTYKVGSELFTQCGPQIVEKIRSIGANVFLDLKFYDIPNTVSKSVAAAARLDIQMLTIHTSGGRQMMEYALKSAQDNAKSTPPLILGVTVLTSFSDQQLAETGMATPISDQVIRLVELGISSGLTGFVCSPLEIEVLRRSIPNHVQLVTPGIRPAHSQNDDQKRVMGPKEALAKGANHLVIGRPIYAADNPAQAADSILKDLAINS